MTIELDKPVKSVDGKRIGSVDSLVIDYQTKEITGIIVRSGIFFETDRILPIDTFDHTEDDGTVVLTLSEQESMKQQEFVERDYMRWDPNQQPFPYTSEAWVNSAGSPSVFWAYGTEPLGFTGQAPFLVESTPTPPLEEVQTNLPYESVLVDKGTDVVGSEGKKIGTVEEIAHAENGTVDAIVVKAGFIFHHDVRIPGRWIGDISSNRVTLNVTADEAEAAHVE